MKALLRRVSRWLFSVYFLVPVGLAVSAWFGYVQVKPQITHIPAVPAGGNLVIQGHGFGGSSGLVLAEDGSALQGISSWEDGQIVANHPNGSSGALVQVERRFLFFTLRSQSVPIVFQQAGLPSQPYGYDVPVQPESPWPLFRRDRRNTASSPLPAVYNGDQPWMVQTGKGIFSTPIIDQAGNIYFGSADHNFYAVAPDGRILWQFPTGEIIDSAGILPRVRPGGLDQTILFPSADGYLYEMALGSALKNPASALLWKFDARVSPRASYNNWWEGNVAVGFDGTLYAGNTNFNYYAIKPDGSLKWTYATAANNWSIAAIGDDGTIFWGSNDTYIRAVDAAGREKWRTMTLGFIAASAMLGSDGTVYIGSFDSYFYALDPDSGQVKWKFKTGDHIYASAAEALDANGHTTTLYVASTDGRIYALTPQGKLLWQYDAGDPIRSSPVLGKAPHGDSDIVYFGAGNGRLYALDAASGKRRWSFDTTSDDPILRDRNDLNGSPALGKTGVYIGGEHGQMWYVPYDYCLHSQDKRCSVKPAEDLPANVTGLFYVSPGGSVEMQDPANLPAAGLITEKLLVRQNGLTLNAHLCNLPVFCPKDALQIKTTPEFSFLLQKSADGRYIYILPDGFLKADTQYTISIDGAYFTGGLSLGNLTLGGKQSGRFHDDFSFRTHSLDQGQIPLKKLADQVTALEWTRLAVPIPPMMPSLNQIGFDYMDWILGTADITPPNAEGKGKFLVWVVGGKRDDSGKLGADPKSEFMFPLSGEYQGSAYILTNKKVSIPVTGIPIPFNYLDMRGELNSDGSARPGTTLYADTDVLSIPTFGPLLVVAGLANNVYEKLIVSATYLIHPYDSAGSANLRPAGVSVEDIQFIPPAKNQDGLVQVQIKLAAGAAYPAATHRPGVLLVDANSLDAVYLDYIKTTTTTSDAAGNLATISLRIPAGTVLPRRLKAYVMLDAFPLESKIIP